MVLSIVIDLVMVSHLALLVCILYLGLRVPLKVSMLSLITLLSDDIIEI